MCNSAGKVPAVPVELGGWDETNCEPMDRRSELAHLSVWRAHLVTAKPNSRYHLLCFRSEDFPLFGCHLKSVLRENLSYRLHNVTCGIAGKD
jgi:hypothetical protein